MAPPPPSPAHPTTGGIPVAPTPIGLPFAELSFLALGASALAFLIVSSDAHRIVVLLLALGGGVSLLNMRVAANRERAQRHVEMIYHRYDLSPLGFLPERPMERLEGSTFMAWEELSEQLPYLNQTGKLRAAVDRMPMVGAGALAGLEHQPRQLKRACVLLSELVHSYVYGDLVPWERLDGGVAREAEAVKAVREVPAQLAVPFVRVCETLGLPPVLCASTTDLWNWTFAAGGGGRRDEGGDAVGATVTSSLVSR